MRRYTVASLVDDLAKLINESHDTEIYFAPYGATDWHDMERINFVELETREGEADIVVLRSQG